MAIKLEESAPDITGNKVLIPRNLLSEELVLCYIRGNNNSIKISGIRFKPRVSTAVIILLLGNGAEAEIGLLRRAINVSFSLGNCSRLYIGNNTSFRSDIKINVSDSCQIEIGEDCMFSSNIVMRTTDSHAIYDNESNTLINPDQNIKIGSHVWIGKDVTVLKGATIENGSVIGTGSVVSGYIPRNCIAAGNPAKVIRENIRWER